MGPLTAHLRFLLHQKDRAISRAISRRRLLSQIQPERFGSLGDGASIGLPARIEGASRIFIGNGVIIAAHSYLSVVREYAGIHYDPQLVIGDRSNFGENLLLSCCGRITIGSDVLASARVFIGDTYHDYATEAPPLSAPMASPRAVTIGDGVFLGVGCSILPGVTIGERAYVGAGAVVTKDVPARTVVAGNPARVIKSI